MTVRPAFGSAQAPSRKQKGAEPAQNNAAEGEAPGEEHYVSRQKLEKGVTQARLSNGLKCWCKRIMRSRCDGPLLHSQYGSALREVPRDGLSHLLEHLVAERTTSKRSEDEIRRLMDSLGGQTNAYTSDEVTAFYIDCPSKNVDVAITSSPRICNSSLIQRRNTNGRWEW